MKSKLLFLILLSFLSLGSSAQNNNRKFKVTGSVFDVNGDPVAHAMILVDGKKTKSLTNEAGRYRVRVNGNSTTLGILTFADGMMGELINGRNEINFNFNTSVSMQPPRPGDETIDIGYGYIRKKNLLTQIDMIDGTNQKYASYSSIFDMIERECSGVKVLNGSVIIQSSTNLNGYIPALYIVDGAYVDNISAISPVTVESIQVLKGTSASIYGSRGYGGAVIIKTRLNN